MDIESFLETMELQRGCTKETIRAYRSDLKMFVEFMREHGLSRITEVTHQVIKDYIRHMEEAENPRSSRTGLSQASIGRRLAAVSSFVEYVRFDSKPDVKNPIREAQRRWKKNDEPKPVDEETIDRLLGGITNLRDRMLFILFLASGLRISEMHQLNRDSIVVNISVTAVGKERILGIGEVIGKGGKPRRIFVDDQSMEVYFEYLRSRTDIHPALFVSERKQRLSVRAIQYTLDAWCRKLGLDHINVHRLRHTYATRLANAGIDLITLKDLMGHNSPRTTQGYYKLTDNTLAVGYFSAMEHVNGYRRGSTPKP